MSSSDPRWEWFVRHQADTLGWTEGQWRHCNMITERLDPLRDADAEGDALDALKVWIEAGGPQ